MDSTTTTLNCCKLDPIGSDLFALGKELSETDNPGVTPGSKFWREKKYSQHTYQNDQSHWLIVAISQFGKKDPKKIFRSDRPTINEAVLTMIKHGNSFVRNDFCHRSLQ